MDASVKKKYLEHVLEQGLAMLHVNAKSEGVRVPLAVAAQHGTNLRLNLSWRFKTPMEIRDDGVSATLTFGASPFDCFIPWHAVWGISQGGELVAWEFKMPPDITMKLEEMRKAKEEEKQKEAEREAEAKKAAEERLARRKKLGIRAVNDDES